MDDGVECPTRVHTQNSKAPKKCNSAARNRLRNSNVLKLLEMRGWPGFCMLLFGAMAPEWFNQKNPNNKIKGAQL